MTYLIIISVSLTIICLNLFSTFWDNFLTQKIAAPDPMAPTLCSTAISSTSWTSLSSSVWLASVLEIIAVSEPMTPAVSTHGLPWPLPQPLGWMFLATLGLPRPLGRPQPRGSPRPLAPPWTTVLLWLFSVICKYFWLFSEDCSLICEIEQYIIEIDFLFTT